MKRTGIHSAIARRPNPDSGNDMMPAHLNDLPITGRQYTTLRRRGAFGQRARQVGSGNRINYTTAELEAIRTIAAEYTQLLAEFEARYQHIATGGRWADLTHH